MSEQTPLPENLAALIGSTTNPAPEPNFEYAWLELLGYVRHAAEHGDDITTPEIVDFMQDLHERNHLPARFAPKCRNPQPKDRPEDLQETTDGH